MKKIILNYSFNAAAKTVTFVDYAAILREGILLIANVADNAIIYNFADPLKGGTVNNNVLLLAYDTAAMDNGDDLLIFYDDAADYPLTDEELRAADVEVGLKDVFLALKHIANILARPIYLNAALNALLVSNPTAANFLVTASIASSQTLATLTNITQVGGLIAAEAVQDISRAKWALAIRGRIT